MQFLLSALSSCIYIFEEFPGAAEESVSKNVTRTVHGGVDALVILRIFKIDVYPGFQFTYIFVSENRFLDLSLFRFRLFASLQHVHGFQKEVTLIPISLSQI